MYKVSYAGNGSTTEFSFTCPYFENSNIVVTKNGAPATGYSIIGNSDGADANFPFSGGTVVFETAPFSRDSITITRQLPLNRIADYQPTARIKPTTLNQDLNYLIELLKDRKAELDALRAQYADIADKESTDVLLAQMTAIHNEIVALGNISQIHAAIETLSTRTTGLLDYVVESQAPTYANSYTWYRKYKSGWVEQGRKSFSITSSTTTIINLPVPMASLDYAVISYSAHVSEGGIFVGESTVMAAPKDQNSIYIGQYNSAKATMTVGYEVKGMRA